MCITMFYAQVIGLWLFFVSLAMMVHHQQFKKNFTESLSQPGLISFSGVITLAVGLLIVASHNVWVAAWPVLITLFGWFLLLQGIARLFWPHHFASHMKNLMAKNGFTVMNWVWLLIGLYLIYQGFFAG